jgi:type IV fimbrial biogenesis protein FimT
MGCVMRNNRHHGFSALELLTTILLFGSLLALAAPGVDPLLRPDRLSGYQAEFTATLAFARSEAIQKKAPALITATAPRFGNEFGGGWKAWIDRNGNGTPEPEELIEDHGPLPADATLKASGNSTTLAFDAHGALSPSAAVQFSLCPVGSATRSYLITVQPSGLPNVSDNKLCP